MYNVLPVPILYIEAKFIPLEKKIKDDLHQSRRLQPFLTQKNWRNFRRAESRTSWRKTKKIQIKVAKTCNKKEQQQYAKQQYAKQQYAKQNATKWTKSSW
jgi:hypothetical protein